MKAVLRADLIERSSRMGTARPTKAATSGAAEPAVLTTALDLVALPGRQHHVSDDQDGPVHDATVLGRVSGRFRQSWRGSLR